MLFNAETVIPRWAEEGMRADVISSIRRERGATGGFWAPF